jgi:rRNA maturation endonuclease Nob1
MCIYTCQYCGNDYKEDEEEKQICGSCGSHLQRLTTPLGDEQKEGIYDGR